MVKQQQKGKAGTAVLYMTRTQALRKLQVKLPEFRRLCILKGIFPREPRKKVHGQAKTYYHVKDIAFLEHEPLLQKFRDRRTHERKIKKAKSRSNQDLARRLQKLTPGYTLDHLIRERYPTFIDAVRDLDDPLTLVNLFALLPAEKKHLIPHEKTQTCRRLCLEFQAFVARTHSLRKSFVSIKGIYYQADVQGEPVTWLVPHALSQEIPSDVDYRVMLTFLEFYVTLMGFINFRLYNSIDMNYPPLPDGFMDPSALGLPAVMKKVNAFNKAIKPVLEEPSETKKKSGSESKGNEETVAGKVLETMSLIQQGDTEPMAVSDSQMNASKEKESLLFVIRACGGKAGWEGQGSPFPENYSKITHHVADRSFRGHKFLDRHYVQPQWVYDCLNFDILIPTEKYSIGLEPPPHLSPFVDNEAEGYVPDYAKFIDSLKGSNDSAQKVSNKDSEKTLDMDDEDEKLDHDLDTKEENLAKSLAMEAEGISYAEGTRAKKSSKPKKKLAYGDDIDDSLIDVNEVGSNVESLTQDQGDDDDDGDDETKQKLAARKKRAEKEEDDAMTQIMLSRKKRGLYEAMQMGIAKKKAKNMRLLERRKMLAASLKKKQRG